MGTPVIFPTSVFNRAVVTASCPPAASRGDLHVGPQASPLTPITVVVGNWNKTGYLPLLFSQYAAQDYPKDKFRIILTDSSSTDYQVLGIPSPAEIAKAAADTYGLNIEAYTVSDTGCPNIRWNVGLRRATDGGLTILNECDVMPVGKEFLSTYAATFTGAKARNQNFVLFCLPFAIAHACEYGGAAHTHDSTARAQEIINWLNIADFNALSYTHYNRRDADFGCGYPTDMAKHMQGYFEGANGWGGAEGNFYGRVRSQKGVLLYCPSLCVLHMGNYLVTPHTFIPKAAPTATVNYKADITLNDSTWGTPQCLVKEF